MYRIFCESLRNYIKEFEQADAVNEYRCLIALPLKLIADLEMYNAEKAKASMLYRQVRDLLHYMKNNIEKYPKFEAFLWTLESRDITAEYYGVSSKEDLEEQAKLVNMILNLVYWDSNIA
ncbi:MAG: hypothetical protein APF77_24130 [Clostridia bacterium BRH_c25]|nr:MAG: hypothetical protein APF77_24130 [Clostridia bacterium BRH_c25]